MSTWRTGADRWGLLAPLFAAAMSRSIAPSCASSDDTSARRPRCRARRRLRGRHVLERLRTTVWRSVAGVDFVDLSKQPALAGHRVPLRPVLRPGDRTLALRPGHDVALPRARLRSAPVARAAATPSKPDGCLIIEVPRLDSLSFRLFRDRWPGIQAPQHTALFDRKTAAQRRSSTRRFEVVGLSALRGVSAVLLSVLRSCVQGAARARTELSGAPSMPYFAGQTAAASGAPAPQAH